MQCLHVVMCEGVVNVCPIDLMKAVCKAEPLAKVMLFFGVVCLSLFWACLMKRISSTR